MIIIVMQGLIPIVGAAREAGTSMLIEDVACPVDKLADMMIDLIDMFQRYGYHDASCFGHALEGNLHLVFSQVRGGVWETCGGLWARKSMRCEETLVHLWCHFHDNLNRVHGEAVHARQAKPSSVTA